MFLASGFARGLLAVSAIGLLAAGCGDGPTCPSEIVLVIQTPAEGAELSGSDDSNANEAGIQTDVTVRSNLKSGNSVTLTIKADGGAVEEVAGTADNDGNVTFAGVTLPGGSVALGVTGTSDCGTGSDESTVSIVTDADCDLTIVEGPIANDFFAPIPVLNSSNDSDSDMPNFQANFSVQSSAGFDVEIFVLDIEAGSEASVATGSTDANGLATFQTTLAQGRQAIRATCKRGSVTEASATSTVQVDTVVPVCTLTVPTEDITVTPDHDADENAEGIQQFWRGTVDDAAEDDTVGQSSSFFRDTSEFAGTAVDADGNVATAALAEFTAPGTFAVRVVTQDNAGNNCEAGFDAKVVMDGCSITIDNPTTTLTADSDSGADGMQADLVVQVGTECAGQEVFVDCGQGEESAIAPANGTTPVSGVTLSASAVSQGQTECDARVVSLDAYQTSAMRTVSWDTQAPDVALVFVDPSGLACGQTIGRTSANDADGNLTNGFQIDVLPQAPFAEVREAVVVNSICPGPNGCVTVEPGLGANIRVTLQPGDNDVQAVARDAFGNEGTSGACNVTLADIAVAFDNPVASGLLSTVSPGVTVNAGNVEIEVCGTVSDSAVTVTLRVDDTTAYPTTVTVGAETTWCTTTDVVLSESGSPHSLVATADSTGDTRTGAATVVVAVDISAPAAPTGFALGDTTRQSLAFSWDVSGDAASYMLRYREGAFTDFPNEGTGVAVGAATSAIISQLDIGTDYTVGLAAVDAAGNISAPATETGLIPLLDPTGSRNPVAGEAAAYGYTTVTANFNGDDWDDLAVGAPFQVVDGQSQGGVVYVYLGSAAGIGTVPDVTITGAPSFFGQFGHGLAALNWGGGANKGLAVGAHFDNGFSGRVYIFHDTTITAATAAGGGDGTLDALGAADLTIEANPTANRFSGGVIGWTLAAGQIDGQGLEDLVIATPSAGAGRGGAVILYGGTVTTPASPILLSDTDAAGLNGLVGHYFQHPGTVVANSRLGYSVSYLGSTSQIGVGDVAISYNADAFDSLDAQVDSRTFILSGRTGLPASGLEEIFLGANDLVLEHTNADTTTRFGEDVVSLGRQNVLRDIVISAWEQGTGELWIVDSQATSDCTIDTYDTNCIALSDSTGFQTRISGVSNRFGADIANNALAVAPDIDNDGVEDLLVAGGIGAAVRLYIWLGDEIPNNSTTSASASHEIVAPIEFRGSTLGTEFGPLVVTWLGDVNGDGLSDICWSDYTIEDAGGNWQEGRLEILWDDGI